MSEHDHHEGPEQSIHPQRIENAKSYSRRRARHLVVAADYKVEEAATIAAIEACQKLALSEPKYAPILTKVALIDIVGKTKDQLQEESDAEMEERQKSAIVDRINKKDGMVLSIDD